MADRSIRNVAISGWKPIIKCLQAVKSDVIFSIAKQGSTPNQVENTSGSLKKMKKPRSVKITDRLIIPEDELLFTASRSSGAGGQNVNKVSTRITLWFDVLKSPSLSEEEKRLLLNKLPTRINKAGWLWINAQQTRSQAGNRELALQRFVELLAQGLVQPRFRKKTRIPRRVKEERLADKKRRSRVKANRSPASFE
jgi:ribosome-associated protein